MATPITSSMLSTKEAAAILGMEETTLRGWRCDGVGPPFYQITPRAVRYDRADLQRYKAERRCVPSVRHTKDAHAAFQKTA
ncbi:MAG: helix-turn-helix domain-containing protein [Acidobacteriota bacterium]|nr:helix-turn-helix domain-containing protein [Acidobacteriota bacterium]